MNKLHAFLLSILVVMLVCISFSAAEAVEKKEKSATPAASKPTTGDSSASKKPADTVRRFDNFVDANKNGIDDRREKAKLTTNSATPKKSPKPTPKPVKDTTVSKKP